MSDGWPTLADVHSEVQATRRELQALCTEMRAQRREVDDHETRIRSLSRWRWTAAGGLVVLAMLAGSAGWVGQALGGG